MIMITISDLHNLCHLLLVDYSIAVNIVHPAKETVRDKKWKVLDDMTSFSTLSFSNNFSFSDQVVKEGSIGRGRL